MNQSELLTQCKAAIARWQDAFNNQDADGCAAQYNENATMQAKPLGVFEGREQIQAFWQNLIDQGFAEVDYTDVQWQAEGEKSYLLSAKWSMNKAFGVIHKEHWQLEADGKARLISDYFEILGER